MNSRTREKPGLFSDLPGAVVVFEWKPALKVQTHDFQMEYMGHSTSHGTVAIACEKCSCTPANISSVSSRGRSYAETFTAAVRVVKRCLIKITLIRGSFKILSVAGSE